MSCLDALNRDYLVKVKQVSFGLGTVQRRQLWFLAKHYADCGIGDVCSMIVCDFLRKCESEGLFSGLPSDYEEEV